MSTISGLSPYAAHLVADWLRSGTDQHHQRIVGTMAFVDISGFTALTERLARRGVLGAELMSDTLNQTFAALLAVADADGGDLLKWGGDAVLLLFEGTQHAPRAARAAHRMRAELRGLVRRKELPVSANLRMSIGIHSGAFNLFLVGDPDIHRELIVTGPEITELALLESVSQAGQIGVSAATAALLPSRLLGTEIDRPEVAGARLLRSCPPPVEVPRRAVGARVEVSGTLSPPIRAHLTMAAGESEHRPVTVAFVGFSGSDAVVREQGPEAMAEAVDHVVRTVQHACREHQVTFLESDLDRDGGKILLVAGAPRSAGGDEERMLRTALDIVSGQQVLRLRVGVTRGHVFAGDFGPPFRRTYSIKGDAVNLAARLQGRTRPGGVLAMPEVVAHARAVVETEALEPFTVKGKSLPVRAVEVLGLRKARAAVPSEAAFVGREVERARLRAAIDGTTERRGCVIDLVGEPGIGKSRLVAELGPMPPGLVVLSATSGGYDSGTPYSTFRVLLSSALGLSDRDDPPLVEKRLTDRVRDNAPHLLPWLPLLAVPLDLTMAATAQTRDLDVKFRKNRLEELSVELLACILPTPTLLIVEDAHLMDEASSGILSRLEAETATKPWCLLATRRETPVGYLPDPGGPDYLQITLGPLDPEAAYDLLETSARGSTVRASAFRAMAARAAGNPLFLVSLATAGPRTSDAMDLPESVEDVLISEVDRLDPSDRTLLRYAAVLGTRFDSDLLAEVLPGHVDGRQVAHHLEHFVRPLERGFFEFRHSLMRDVAYAGLPFRLRREMHGRVALALERAPGDPATDADRLSLHFHGAGLHDQAWTYSLLAGEHARERYAYDEAVGYFERAVASASELPHLSSSARSAAYVSLGESRDMTGQSAGAVAAFRRARGFLSDDPVRTADLMYREARVILRTGRFARALGLLTRSMRVLDGTPGSEADAVRARVATRYGFCRHLQGRHREAVVWGRAGVRWAVSSGDESTVAHSYNALHLALGSTDEREERPYGQLALSAYQSLGDLRGQALCLNNLAIDAYRAGRWTEAVGMFDRAAASFKRIGDDANRGNAAYNRGDVLVAQGRYEEALPVLRDALRLARRMDDQELVALALREGARAYAGLGDLARAEGLFDQAGTIFAELHIVAELVPLTAARAEALAMDGQVERALELLGEAQSDAEAMAPSALTRLHRVRAQTLLAAGRSAAAAAEARAGLARGDRGHDGYEPGLLRLALADATAAAAATTATTTENHDPARQSRHEALAALGALGVVRAGGHLLRPPWVDETDQVDRGHQ